MEENFIYISDVEFGYEAEFYNSSLVRMEKNEFSVVSPFVNLRTSYEDVEEIVDDRYFVPSSVAVTQRSRSYQGLYDSDAALSDSRVARLNASVRHPSADIVDVTNRAAQLKRITVEYVDADKAAADAASSENTSAVANTPSDVPKE